jgi:hypothetical protein
MSWLRREYLDYASILSWDTRSAPQASWVVTAFNRLLSDAFESWDDPRLSPTIAEMKLLPQECVERIIFAPDTFFRLTGALSGEITRSELSHFLEISTHVEKLRIGQHAPGGVGRWSAMGDYRSLKLPNSFMPGDSSTSRDGHYTATLLGGRIPLDSQSIFAHRPMANASFRPERYGDPVPFEFSSLANTEMKIIDAFAMIEEVSQTIANFVLEQTQTIVLRRNNADAFISSSCDSFIGQTVLLNPDLSHVDTAILAESLVHEAIHALLLRAEVLWPSIKDPDVALSAVSSPWSGRPLHYYTLLGACFVWYGLLSFWTLGQERNVFSRERTKLLHDRARSGFLTKQIMSQIDVHATSLSEGWYDVVARLVENGERMASLRK